MTKKDIINMAIKVLVIVLLIAVLYWAAKQLKQKAANAITNIRLVETANQEIDTRTLQMTTVQVQSCVSKLKEGFYSGAFGWTEDEDIIYAAFEMIPTRSDLLTVMSKFGVYKDKTLVEHVNSLLSQKEISHINGILAAHNINYSF